ncbi:acyl carrier protein [Streptomyces sp. NPDC127068]|uniref:acyl carrier protein n=1 Tax=Streptomyces sp. NPDC127068 TaxID=3347127 RepID=UPI00364943EB
MQQQLISVLAHQIDRDPDSLRPEMTFRELEVDSLTLIEVIVTLESDLGIDLPADLDGVTAETTLGRAAEIIQTTAAGERRPAVDVASAAREARTP